MNEIKLIACDLDGTLLLHGAQACTRKALELIGELCDRGIYFVPASGRQYPNLRRLFASGGGPADISVRERGSGHQG